MIKLVLDTDIGSEVDDAACLAYLLCQPRCSLLGITTTGSFPVARAAMARGLVSLAGRDDIPVVAGAAAPLALPPPEQVPRQLPAARPEFESGENAAPAFLRELIRLHPSEVTLVSIAPLTNVALLFALDPDAPRLLKRHVIVGGDFGVSPPARGEWNIRSDPHAAALVYRAGCADTLTLGQDTVGLVGLPAPAVREQFQIPILRRVLSLSEERAGLRDFVRLDDAVAAVSVFEPGIVETVPADIDYPWEDAARRSGPTWRPSPTGRHQLVRFVDRPKFFSQFFSVFPDWIEFGEPEKRPVGS